MNQCSGLEGVSVAPTPHTPAGHEAQFRIYALGQPGKGRFIAAAPGSQQSRDFSRGSADGQAALPPKQKNIPKRGRFSGPFPIIPAEGNPDSDDRQIKQAQRRFVMKSSTIAKIFTFVAVTALALSIAPTAKADDKGCSNLSLQGTFAYTGTGFVVTPAVIAGPFAEVGTQTFDGTGGTTTTFTASQNGNIFQTTFTGTYTMNADCTGTITLIAPPPPPPAPQAPITITLFFVIDYNLSEFHAIETLPGAVVTRIGRRLFPGRNI
jgi:hypothetical protein